MNHASQSSAASDHPLDGAVVYGRLPTLRWRLLIYFTVWVVAASILATRSELYLDDDSTETSTRCLVFVASPIIILTIGLDFAMQSAFHWDPGQAGDAMWIVVVAFISHAMATFSNIRRATFFALIAILVVALSIGVFYALRFHHLAAALGHG